MNCCFDCTYLYCPNPATPVCMAGRSIASAELQQARDCADFDAYDPAEDEQRNRELQRRVRVEYPYRPWFNEPLGSGLGAIANALMSAAQTGPEPRPGFSRQSDGSLAWTGPTSSSVRSRPWTLDLPETVRDDIDKALRSQRDRLPPALKQTWERRGFWPSPDPVSRDWLWAASVVVSIPFPEFWQRGRVDEAVQNLREATDLAMTDLLARDAIGLNSEPIHDEVL